MATPADARSEAFTASFPSTTEYCKDTAEDDKAKAAMLDSLKSSGDALCINQNYCSMDSFDCSWADNKLTIKFSLVQTDKLSDSSILTDTAASIKASKISLSLDISRRRKRATSFVSEEITSETVTTCGSGFIAQNGYCVQCPVGYGLLDGACVPCPIGSYSAFKSIAACTLCSNNFKTLSSGSTRADQCKDPATLCIVPAAHTNTGLNPPTEALLDSGTAVTVSCSPGYALEGGIAAQFSCSADPISPICYSKCTVPSIERRLFGKGFMIIRV